MKYIPGYLDSFISPVTGKLISNTIIPLSYNYILIGDREGNAIEGPALIDVWLEIRNIKEKLSSAKFILQTSSPNFIKSQALDQVPNGLISNLDGTIIQTHLTKDNIWIGNNDNLPIETTTLPIGTLPDLPSKRIWKGDDNNRAVPTGLGRGLIFIGDPSDSGAIIENGLTYGKTVLGDSSNRIIEAGLAEGYIFMGDSNGHIIEIGLGPRHIFMGDPDGSGAMREVGLDAGIMFIGDPSGNGEIISTGLGANYIFIGNENDSGEIIATLFEIVCGTGLSGGTIVGNGTIAIANTGVIAGTYAYATVSVNLQGQILSASDNSSSISNILNDLSNLANIVNAISNTVDALSSTVNAIETGIASIGGFAAILLLQAQVFGLIGAVASLSSRIGDVENDVTIIQGQITTIQNQISNIQGQISDIYTQIGIINGYISTIQGQIIDIYDQLSSINDRIDNLSASFIGDVQGGGLLSSPITLELILTLDQIKKAQNSVDLNHNKIINLVSDDVEQLDALNAQFLWDLMHDNVGVVYV